MLKKPRFVSFLSAITNLLFYLVLFFPVFHLYSSRLISDPATSAPVFEKVDEGYLDFFALFKVSDLDTVGIFLAAILLVTLVIFVWHLVCLLLKFSFSTLFTFVQIICFTLAIVVGFVGGYALYSVITIGLLLLMILMYYLQIKTDKE